MYRRILVPTDGSACSELAITHALAIAHAMGSVVVFLFAMDTLSLYQEGVVSISQALDALTAQGQEIIARANSMAAKANLRADAELAEGTPAEVITRRSDDFDLIVMGSHGKGILKRLTVGSVTQSVLRRIKRPLLVIRCPREES